MELNKEQALVVNEHTKNILLLASAGTGKTDTLSKRVASIISKKKAEPSEILCITFTNKACKEMRMSYSKAYKIIQRAEKDLGYKLLIGKTGGTGGGGSELTAEAMELVKFFNRLKANTEKFVKMQMEEEIKSKKSV